MATIRVYEIATFYTMFQLEPVGKKAHVQVCGTTPCMLRGSGALIGVCERRIAGHAHELSKDGNFSWEEVECLGSCANAPLVQIGKDTYEDLTPDMLEKILDGFERGKPPLPGSQIGRKASCPKGGASTLTDPALYDGSLNAAWHKRFHELSGEPAAEAAPAAAAPAPAAAAPAASAPAPSAAKPAMHPAAAALIANAGIVPELEKRGSGAPLAIGEIEKLKSGGARADAGEPSGAQSSKGTAPELLKGPKSGAADELTLIWGVGPKLQEQLYALGVYHFAQIAAWTDDNLTWADGLIADLRRRAERDKWIEQAKKLATGWRPDNSAGEKVK